jgi:hypothetical protein
MARRAAAPIIASLYKELTILLALKYHGDENISLF